VSIIIALSTSTEDYTQQIALFWWLQSIAR